MHISLSNFTDIGSQSIFVFHYLELANSLVNYLTVNHSAFKEKKMKYTSNDLRVVATLMECEALDEAAKEFIQRTVMKAAKLLEAAKFINNSNKEES